MAVSKDVGRYYKVPPDMRDLNYNKFIDQGSTSNQVEEYTSHNTVRLDIKGVEDLLLKVDEVKEYIK